MSLRTNFPFPICRIEVYRPSLVGLVAPLDFPGFLGAPGGFRKVREAGRMISFKGDHVKRPSCCRVISPKTKVNDSKVIKY